MAEPMARRHKRKASSPVRSVAPSLPLRAPTRSFITLSDFVPTLANDRALGGPLGPRPGLVAGAEPTFAEWAPIRHSVGNNAAATAPAQIVEPNPVVAPVANGYPRGRGRGRGRGGGAWAALMRSI